MTENQSSMDDIIEVWMYLDHAMQSLMKIREKELQEIGLSEIQNRILMTLKFLDHEPTLGELAGWLFREHNTISHVTGTMSQNGLIRKYPDESRKRATRIALTKKGEQVLAAAKQSSTQLRLLTVFSTSECRQLVKLMRKLLDRTKSVNNSRYMPDIDKLVKAVRTAYQDSSSG